MRIIKKTYRGNFMKLNCTDIYSFEGKLIRIDSEPKTKYINNDKKKKLIYYNIHVEVPEEDNKRGVYDLYSVNGLDRKKGIHVGGNYRFYFTSKTEKPLVAIRRSCGFDWDYTKLNKSFVSDNELLMFLTKKGYQNISGEDSSLNLNLPMNYQNWCKEITFLFYQSNFEWEAPSGAGSLDCGFQSKCQIIHETTNKIYEAYIWTDLENKQEISKRIQKNDSLSFSVIVSFDERLNPYFKIIHLVENIGGFREQWLDLRGEADYDFEYEKELEQAAYDFLSGETSDFGEYSDHDNLDDIWDKLDDEFGI